MQDSEKLKYDAYENPIAAKSPELKLNSERCNRYTVFTSYAFREEKMNLRGNINFVKFIIRNYKPIALVAKLVCT